MATPVTDHLTRVRRAPGRGSDDRAVVDAILDAAFVCHLGYLVGDRPVVVPTLYGRDGDHLVLHGASASRAMRTAGAGLPVCVTVTLVDGLVLARSAFHHSANYRSVVIHGEASPVDDPDDKVAALRILTEQVTPGRWAQVRWPTPSELKATSVLRLPLDAAVAKVRTGGVNDDAADLDLPVWAGVVPIETVYGTPVGEPDLTADVAATAPGVRPPSAGAPAR